MDNKELARKFMEMLNEKTEEELIAEVNNSSPTGLGEILYYSNNKEIWFRKLNSRIKVFKKGV